MTRNTVINVVAHCDMHILAGFHGVSFNKYTCPPVRTSLMHFMIVYMPYMVLALLSFSWTLMTGPYYAQRCVYRCSVLGQ